MPEIKRSEMRLLDKILVMERGYVLNFSDRTMSEFFEDELGINIFQKKYKFNGSSKARYLRTFVKMEDGYIVGQLLRKLWDYKLSCSDQNEKDLEKEKNILFNLIESLENSNIALASQHLSETVGFLNFDTVSRDLKRATDNCQSDPESAVTSACSTVESVCRSIILELKQDLPARKDMKGLFDAVKKPLGLSPDKENISNDVKAILGGLATVIGGIGALRTHYGDAHGRERQYRRIDSRIASLAINSASAVSLFLLET